MTKDFRKKALETVYKERWNVTDELYEQCIALSDVVAIPKGTNFIQQDKIQNTIYFVVSGIARGVTYAREKRDLTDCFMYEPGEAIYACNSLTNPCPASVYVNAVTDCVFVTLSRTDLNRILASHHHFYQIYIRYMEQHLEDCRMLEIIRSKTSIERYSWFCQRHPKIVDRLPIHCILSYLDISEAAYRQAKAEI